MSKRHTITTINWQISRWETIWKKLEQGNGRKLPVGGMGSLQFKIVFRVGVSEKVASEKTQTI